MEYEIRIRKIMFSWDCWNLPISIYLRYQQKGTSIALILVKELHQYTVTSYSNKGGTK
jgi:hypothetical protein